MPRRSGRSVARRNPGDTLNPGFETHDMCRVRERFLRSGDIELHDLAPFLDFFGNELSEIGGRTRNYGAAQVKAVPLLPYRPSQHSFPC
jgi:hypothetical protein